MNRLPTPLDVHQKDVTALTYGGIRPVQVAIIYGDDDAERLARANDLALAANNYDKLMAALEDAIEIIHTVGDIPDYRERVDALDKIIAEAIGGQS